MKAVEYQSVYSSDLKKFLETQAGKELLGTVHGCRPSYDSNSIEHVFIENRGAIRGFELCLATILGLANPPRITEQVEADYGVPDKKQTKE